MSGAETATPPPRRARCRPRPLAVAIALALLLVIAVAALLLNRAIERTVHAALFDPAPPLAPSVRPVFVGGPVIDLPSLPPVPLMSSTSPLVPAPDGGIVAPLGAGTYRTGHRTDPATLGDSAAPR